MTTTSASPRMLPAGLIGYAEESARPLISLLFVSPMLLAYEAGVLLWPQAMRNGADVWLRKLLDLAGLGQYFLLPVLTCGVLLGWHHVRRDAWKASPVTLLGMLVESICLAMLLLIWAHFQGDLLHAWRVHWTCAVAGGSEAVRWILAFCGAGIYEELLFRLLLLPALAAALRWAGASPRSSLVAAVLISSVLFAAAHYRFEFTVGSWSWASPLGDAFQWSSFLFRFSAGVCFSLAFIYRGFGIAAVSHALYDVLVWTI